MSTIEGRCGDHREQTFLFSIEHDSKEGDNPWRFTEHERWRRESSSDELSVRFEHPHKSGGCSTAWISLSKLGRLVMRCIEQDRPTIYYYQDAGWSIPIPREYTR